MLGWQEHPVVIETTAWLVYLIPIGLYVCWPPGTSITAHTVKRTAFTVSVAASLAALPLALWPASPGRHSPTTARFTEAGPTRAVATVDVHPMSREVLRVHTSGAGLPEQDWTATRADRIRLDGVPATRYRATIVHAGTQTAVTLQRLATFYGGRLPLGVTANNTIRPVQLTTQTSDAITVDTDHVGGPLNFTYTRSIDQTAQLTRGDTALPVRLTAVRSSPVSQHQLLVTARRAQAAGRHAKTRHALATTFSALCLVSLAVAGSLTIDDARRPPPVANLMTNHGHS